VKVCGEEGRQEKGKGAEGGEWRNWRSRNGRRKKGREVKESRLAGKQHVGQPLGIHKTQAD
jgi:hypothetical protein